MTTHTPTKLSKQITAFELKGRLLAVTLKPNRQIKRLQLQTAAGPVNIRVPRALRGALHPLQCGMDLTVSGRKISNPLTGRIKLKAESVAESGLESLVDPLSPVVAAVPAVEAAAAPAGESTILICRKCQSKSVCKALAAELADRDLDHHVKVEFTGCIKRCDSAPNLVVITPQGAGKTRKIKTHHGKVKRKQIPALLDRHSLSKPAS
jgi:(2Fe-2S) ferredoxin